MLSGTVGATWQYRAIFFYVGRFRIAAVLSWLGCSAADRLCVDFPNHARLGLATGDAGRSDAPYSGSASKLCGCGSAKTNKPPNTIITLERKQARWDVLYVQVRSGIC